MNAISPSPASKRPSAVFESCDGVLQHPVTGEAIRVAEDGCSFGTASGQVFPVVDGIPNLFVPNDWTGPGQPADVTEIVRAFYEETPFPNYDDFDSRESLRQKARRGFFAALLDEQIVPGARVLEVGCGTGQLSNFLGLAWNRKVLGGDLCLNSLRLAKAFADRHSIRNVGFLQMNLFKPPFHDGTFDVVISNGVLHHTGDPEGGFRSLAAKVKPGGHIIVGLYDSYARLPTLWKRWLFRNFGKRLFFLDGRLKDWHAQPQRVRAWFMDQYNHPHESRHSMDDVLAWFGRNGIEFTNAIPHADGTDLAKDEQLFRPHDAGSRAARVMTQCRMLAGGGADGGLFIMIGRRRT